jgi:hypothetical protein
LLFSSFVVKMCSDKRSMASLSANSIIMTNKKDKTYKIISHIFVYA